MSKTFTPRFTKYRAWDHHKMVFVQTLCWSPGGMIWYGAGNQMGWGWVNPACDSWTADQPKPSDADVSPIMEFTGLLDRDGREIYEGDIVTSSNDGSNGCDQWDPSDMGVAVVSMDQNGISIQNGDDYWAWDDDESTYGLKYLFVVGNVFENQDLLKT